MKKFYISFFSLISAVLITTSSFAFDYTWSTLKPSIEVSSSIDTENTDDSSNPLGLDCGSCILVEQHTGQVLYSYNCHEKLAPASVTKLMSIYLIMEAISSRKNRLFY